MSAPDLAGRRFGSWTVLGADPTGKRIVCRCACGRVRQVALAALELGESLSCGCAPLPQDQQGKFRAEAELRRRHAEHDWRPEGRGR